MSLSGLPNELIIRIIENDHTKAPMREVCSPSSTRLNLALVNRRFNELTIPLLYSDVEFGVGDLLSCASSGKLPLFALSILSDDKKAKHVRAIRVDGICKHYHRQASSCKHAKYARPAWERFLNRPGVLDQCLQRFYGRDRAKETTKYSIERRRLVFYLLSLAIVFLPRLQTLTLLNVGYHYHKVLRLFGEYSLRKSSIGRTGYHSVRQLSLGCEDGPTSFSSLCVPLTLGLPSIESVWAGGIGAGSSNPGETLSIFISFPQESAMLRNLRLGWGSQVPYQVLHQLLGRFKHLEAFEYNISEWDVQACLDTGLLERSLKQQCKFLKSVILTYDSRSDPVNGIHAFTKDSRIKPMSFERFENLQSLTLALPLLFGNQALGFGWKAQRRDGLPPLNEDDLVLTEEVLTSALPTKIRSLKFTELGDRWAIMRLNTALLNTLKSKEIRFPRLCSFDFELNHMYLPPNPPVWTGGPFSIQSSIQELRQSVLTAKEVSVDVLPVERVESDRIVFKELYLNANLDVATRHMKRRAWLV